MLVYIAQEQPSFLYFVQDAFVSNTPLVAMARGSSGPGHWFARTQVLLQLHFCAAFVLVNC